MKKILKTIIIAVLSFWAMIGLCLTINNTQDFVHMLSVSDNSNAIMLFSDSPALQGNYSGNQVVWVIVYISIFFLIKKAFSIREKRLGITSLILSILFALFQIVGASITFYLTMDVLFSYFFITMIKLTGLIILYYSCMIVLFSKLSGLRETERINELNFFTSNKKSLFIVAGILLLCWVPYLLKEFPGVTEYDSIYQIEQGLGIKELTGWHPVIHTFLIKICIGIGNGLFHSINSGVAIYSIFQMIFMAMIFSFIIWYMAKKKVTFGIRLATFVYFAFCPTFPIMSFTMIKDTIFSGMMALLVIVFIELITNTENVFKSKKNIIFSVIVIMITTLFRNNALYMLILTIPFIVIYKKGYRIKISALLIGSVVVVLGINWCISHVFHVPQTNYVGMSGEIEMYSVPLQQITRVWIDNKDTISVEDKNQIVKFFKKDNFYEVYKPFISDPIKMSVNYEYFSENKTEFFKLWIQLLFKYPKSYVDSFLCLTSGYFDPEENRVSLWTGTYPNDLGIEANSICDLWIVNFAEKLIYAQNIPIIGLFFSTGFVLWIILALLAFNIYQKKYEFSLVFLPVLLYLFTVFFGPLNTEYRYIFFEYTVLPILVGFTICQTNNIINRKEDKNG